MDTIVYDQKIVNECVSNMNNVVNSFDSLSNGMKIATNKIVSAKGFNEYIGGINSDYFSTYVVECGKAVDNLIKTIRQKEISILAYSQDKNAINAFLDTLSNKDFSTLNLSEIDEYISVGRKAGNSLKGIGASITTAGLGLVEGILELVETGADLVKLSSTIFATVYTKGYDLLTGKNVTKKMWEQTKAQVSEKKVESIFNSIYRDTEFGKSIKENAYLFDGVRGISKGLGYTAGLIGLNVITGGMASGLGIGAAGSITAGQLAATAGVLGFSNGTEEAWADGASIEKGLTTGIATGVWEGAQWYAGAKINQIGGLGDQVAKGIFSGATSGVGTRIALDTVDAGLEGFVRPALTMIYKDYGGEGFSENYSKAFQASGGWANVGTQCVMGAFASTIGEFSTARRLLKINEDADIDARRIFASNGERNHSGEALAPITAMLNGEEAAAKRIFASHGDLEAPISQKHSYTINGEIIKCTDNIFNSKTSTKIPDSYQWFSDGAYIPDPARSSRGVFKSHETIYKPDDFIGIIEGLRDSLSAAEYTRYMDAAEIFKSSNELITANAFKLIVNHSEGNIGRIKRALQMNCADSSDEAIAELANKLAKTIFNSDGLSPNARLNRNLINQEIDSLSGSSFDYWKHSNRIIQNLDSKQLIQDVANETTSELLARTNRYFGGKISSKTILDIANCDGYPATIRSILANDSAVPKELLDKLSSSAASKIFKTRNLARLKATYSIKDFDFDTAFRLVDATGGPVERYSTLMKAANVFSSSAVRRTYYHAIDSLVDYGMLEADAIKQAKLMNLNAMTSVGVDAATIKKFASGVNSSNRMYLWNDGLIDSYSNVGKPIASASDYMRHNYRNETGAIDADSIVSDFQALMERKISEIDPKMSGNGDYSTKATKLFMDAYATALEDRNNPNRGEALKFMSKILELENQGKRIHITNNGGKTGSLFATTKDTINLDISTVDGEIYGTVYHETGHAIFGINLGAKKPTHFDAIRLKAEQHLGSENSRRLYKQMAENATEIKEYCNYLADKKLTQKFQEGRKYSGISSYRDWLVGQYDKRSIDDRIYNLGKRSSYRGSNTLDKFNANIRNKLDFKQADACAEHELNHIRNKVSDQIYRTEFSSYQVTSGIIDSATLGRNRIYYGHGPNYFAKWSDRNEIAFNELLADYSSLKVSGDNKSIRFLRDVLGDEIIDLLERKYTEMLQ
ncbi:MAG: hypothetical protein IJI22_03055 [Bacilli bacterium]|nr:hypothetical protein [Bacilli bacterium]